MRIVKDLLIVEKSFFRGLCSSVIHISIFYLIIVSLSPMIVELFRGKFTIHGWTAIGHYSFDYREGFMRALEFYIGTLPLILACFCGKTSTNSSRFLLPYQSVSMGVVCLILAFLTMINLVSFYFVLGITGVETESPFKLSGGIHYLRSYIFPIICAFIAIQKPYFSILFIYSLIAGLTSGSRFVAVFPLVIFLVMHWRAKSNLINLVSITAIGFNFVSISIFRSEFLYVDNFKISELPEKLTNASIDFSAYTIEMINQLFLRLGVGRDVILAYEIRETERCREFLNFITTGQSCLNPALDFYGLYLTDTKWGLWAGTLPSLFILSKNLFVTLALGVGLGIILIMQRFIILKSLSGLKILKIFALPVSLLHSVFVIFGPLKFAHILACLCFFLLVISLICTQRNRGTLT